MQCRDRRLPSLQRHHNLSGNQTMGFACRHKSARIIIIIIRACVVGCIAVALAVAVECGSSEYARCRCGRNHSLVGSSPTSYLPIYFR